MDIIDTQAFYGHWGDLGCTSKDLRRAQEKALNKGHNLRFIIVPVNPKLNDSIASVARTNPDLIVGAYLQVVPLKNNPFYTSVDDIARLSESPQIKGYKTVPSLMDIGFNDKHYNSYFELAEQTQLPFLVHCGSRNPRPTLPEVIENVMDSYGDMKVILAHFGGFPKNFEENIRFVKRYSTRLFLNVTGITGERVDFALSDSGIVLNNSEFDTDSRDDWTVKLKEVTEDRSLLLNILFGTDYNLLSNDNYTLAPIDSLEAAKQLYIFELNPKKIFNI